LLSWTFTKGKQRGRENRIGEKKNEKSRNKKATSESANQIGISSSKRV
jgi:hypothetical protein